jgi:hypothetical protein
MGANYIPNKDAEFANWVKGLYDYAADNYTPWNVPPPQTALKPLLEAFQNAYAAAVSEDRSSVDVARKNDARDALEKKVRAYVREFLTYNSLVTDDDRREMGLPVYKKTHTPIPVPTTWPVLEIDTSTPRQLRVHYHDSGTKKRAKPENAHGAEIRWAQLDERTEDVEDLINSSFDTKQPLILEFKGHERGKRVLLCARWEILRDGKKGPFGPIVEVFIP